MATLRKSPMVNINTNHLIMQFIGVYSLETQELIHQIAEQESELMKSCDTMHQYSKKIKAFIEDSKK